MPEISIIVPVFNAGQFLPRCLDSLLVQTFGDFEIICINDGSNDNCQEILENYAEQDNRITVIYQKNQGVSVARNKGLEMASGNFVTFVDADDYVHPQMLSLMIDIMKKHNPDIVNCLIYKTNTGNTPPCQSMREKTKLYKNPLAAFMKERCIRTGPYARLYKRKLLENMSFEPYVRYEDVPFTTAVMHKAKSLILLEQPLYFYFQHAESFIHQTFTQEKAADYVKIIRLVYRFAQENCPEKLSDIRRYILNNRFKMMINQLIRKQKDKRVQCNIFEFIQKEVRKLFAEGVISYDGLKLKHKIRLFLLLNCRDATLCQVWANLI